MKKRACIYLILVVGIVTGCSLLQPAGRKAEIMISYWDEQAKGKDTVHYETKFMVYLDGELAGESGAADRYEKKSMVLRVSPGNHVVIIEGLALRKGKWENRTAHKGYSIDHRLEKKVTLGAGGKTTINFVVPDMASRMTIRS